MKNIPKKILFKIWLAISTISTITSLASLADSFINWVPFIKEIISIYRQLANFIWGNLFFIMDIKMPQYVHDYLTLNSLFAISITWGFYNTGKELGFSLSSIKEIIFNSILNLKIEGNSFDLFLKKSEEEILDKVGEVSKEVKNGLLRITRPYPTFTLKIESLFSTIFLLSSYLTFSFIIPLFIKRRELLLNSKYGNLVNQRYKELKNGQLPAEEKKIMIKTFDAFCVFQVYADREHIKLYHKIFRKAIGWYLLTVIVIFMLLLLFNYFLLKVLF